jgi:hypothetical protein
LLAVIGYRLHLQHDLRPGPFAGVVQQIAQHLHQVLGVALEVPLGGIPLQLEAYAARRMQLVHGVHQGVQRAGQRGAQAMALLRRCCGGAGAGQVIFDLAAGTGDLLAHQGRQRAVLLRGRVAHDAQRGVDCVSQIARLGAGRSTISAFMRSTWLNS